MDKEWIKIDDLFQQRLSGDEAAERPGAWGAMRNLLDREMPVAPPAGGGRAFRYTAALLLLSTVAAGGYGLFRNSHPKAPLAIGGVTQETVRPVTTGHGSQVASAVSGVATRNTVASSNKSLQPATNGITSGSISTNAGSSTVSATQPKEPNGRKTGTSGNASPANGVDQSAIASSHKVTAANHQSGKSSAGTGGDRVAKPEQSEQSVQALTAKKANSKGAQKTWASAASARKISGADRSFVRDELSSANRNHTAGHKPDGARVQPQLDTARYAIQRDTISQVRIVYHLTVNPATRTASYKADTEVLGRAVIEKQILKKLTEPAPVALSTEGLSKRAARRLRKQWARKMRGIDAPLVASSTPAARATTPVLASAAPASASGAASSSRSESVVPKMVPLAASRVASRQTDITWNPHESLNNFVQNIKMQAAKTRYYAGLMGGINSSIGGPGSVQGFQFGLFGLMAFNERLALGMEAKYFQRFNGSTSLRDDSYTTQRTAESGFTTQNGQQYTIYRYDRDSNSRMFKFSTLSSVELPVTLRYAFNRFSILTGLNLAYQFRIDAEDAGEGKVARQVWYDTTLSSATPPAAISRPAEININDFGSRFGLGYIVGATYEFSPSVHLDLRVTQQFWDNRRSTTGAKIISNTYYQLPMLQLSVGYRFQQQAARSKQ
jgi:hypothetical protein